MTNREVMEEAAGMGLDDSFFRLNNLDPDAEYEEGSEKDNTTSVEIKFDNLTREEVKELKEAITLAIETIKNSNKSIVYEIKIEGDDDNE